PDSITLLWEFDDSKIPADNDVRLGYSFPQPTIARLHNGKWAVVTGNGYHSDGSTHGKAALLIIDLETGALTKSIEVAGEAGIANGLSSPRLGDMNVDGVADYAYAGDLQGNLWRFNLTHPKADADLNPFSRLGEGPSAEAHFKASYGGKPLFKAVASNGVRQPITAAPNIVRHPSRYGYLIIFGTGRYFEVTDKSGTVEKQSVYGIWDTNTRSVSGNESGPGSVSTGALTRSQLQEQTYEVSGSVENSIRTLTQNLVTWAIPPASPEGSWTDNAGHKYGWYFDLSLTGEMMIENMILFGQTLLLQTLVPDDDPCASGAGSWTYGINAQTGGRTRHHIFRDIRHPASPHTPVTAVKQVGEGGLTLGQRPDGTFEICTGEGCIAVNPDPESVGRQSWRQLGEQ
ncbi:MAG: PilC/PilY family type IV pilus protein, partial [Spongiibacteraceae bacterium]|nr:PilC/PilY family type IV pilus protein [Spongiibacteraceae bacterium]